MNINKLAKQIHETAVEKGWWDGERNHDEIFMLIITELSEAIESDRNANSASPDIIEEYRYNVEENSNFDFKSGFEEYIKDTVEDELADAFIRCLDYLYYRHQDNIIINKYAISVSDNFAENIFHICKEVTNRRIEDATFFIMYLCDEYDINLEWHVKQKMKYNGMREKKHGGKKY